MFHRDPLFFEKFFHVAAPAELPAMPEFLAPTELAGFKQFLDEKLPAYYQQMQQLIGNFETWLQQHDLLTDERRNKLAIVLDNFNKHYNAESLQYAFPLFSEAPRLFSTINYFLQQQQFTFADKKSALEQFFDDLFSKICLAGIHTHLHNLIKKFNFNLDTHLMQERYHLAQQAAIEAIQGNCEIGNEIHYANYLLNHCANAIGIEPIQDPYIPATFPQQLLVNFYNSLNVVLSADNFFEHLMNNELVTHFLSKAPQSITPNEMEVISNWLAQYGIDSNFQLTALFYDANEDIYRWHIATKALLINSIFLRLANKHYINLSTYNGYAIDQDKNCLLYSPPTKSINLSFVYYAGQSYTFYEYLVLTLVKNPPAALPLLREYYSEQRIHQLWQQTILAYIQSNSFDAVNLELVFKNYLACHPNELAWLLNIMPDLSDAAKLHLLNKIDFRLFIKNHTIISAVFAFICALPTHQWTNVLTANWGNSELNTQAIALNRIINAIPSALLVKHKQICQEAFSSLETTIHFSNLVCEIMPKDLLNEDIILSLLKQHRYLAELINIIKDEDTTGQRLILNHVDNYLALISIIALFKQQFNIIPAALHEFIKDFNGASACINILNKLFADFNHSKRIDLITIKNLHYAYNCLSQIYYNFQRVNPRKTSDALRLASTLIFSVIEYDELIAKKILRLLSGQHAYFSTADAEMIKDVKLIFPDTFEYLFYPDDCSINILLDDMQSNPDTLTIENEELDGAAMQMIRQLSDDQALTEINLLYSEVDGKALAALIAHQLNLPRKLKLDLTIENCEIDDSFYAALRELVADKADLAFNEITLYQSNVTRQVMQTLLTLMQSSTITVNLVSCRLEKQALCDLTDNLEKLSAGSKIFLTYNSKNHVLFEQLYAAFAKLNHIEITLNCLVDTDFSKRFNLLNLRNKMLMLYPEHTQKINAVYDGVDENCIKNGGYNPTLFDSAPALPVEVEDFIKACNNDVSSLEDDNSMDYDEDFTSAKTNSYS